MQLHRDAGGSVRTRSTAILLGATLGALIVFALVVLLIGQPVNAVVTLIPAIAFGVQQVVAPLITPVTRPDGPRGSASAGEGGAESNFGEGGAPGEVRRQEG
ncbi:hypothetical protein M2160_004264 [Streptomyces sp. SAI-117]|uniref:hypothetical protein n=1 Tax=Streptomyces sp. SAI-117 TaxID=2940546 RepID=UPI002474C2E4|nr:hypothetical protein [Streptomyces sp. SAI-117]MDH6569243.1 hypothetical protein [Streptomyces sp. SAI-117]